MGLKLNDPRLDAGNEAIARRDWDAARRHFEGALAKAESGPAWEGLSWAAWWLNDETLTFRAREAAFRAYRAESATAGAARMAAWIASDHMDFRGDDAVATGWLERAQRLLRDVPESPEHGWVCLMQADFARHAEVDPERALRCAREAARIGRDLAVPDLETVGLAMEGATLAALGRVDEGMRLLDEASALAAGEEFQQAISPGWALCLLVTACTVVGDFPRATQWCSAIRAFADHSGGRVYMGVCRSAYGTVLSTRGELGAADLELTAAVDDLEAARPALAAPSVVRLAELRMRQGRREEAHELFCRARPHHLALVGLGTLDLDAGDAQAAADAAARVLRRLERAGVLDRVPALELLARAQARLGDGDGAARVLAELESAAETIGTPYIEGRACLVAGEVAAAAGKPDDARRAFEDAIDRFEECAAPYDCAIARLHLAETLATLGREQAAAAEADAAREVLKRIGAGEAAARAERVGARAGTGELSAREIEVLRLVGQGLGDAEIAERLVLSPHTVHRHVANARAKLRLPSRAAAVAYAARAGLL